MTSPRSHRVVVLVATAVLGGCTEPTSTPALDRFEGHLAIAMLAVAASHQGSGVLDNFIACPRRGLIDFSNTATGRRVAFSGCDLGDGVTVSGSGEIAWVGPGLESTRAPFCQADQTGERCAGAFRWSGPLLVTAARVDHNVSSFAVRDLVMRADGARFPADASVATTLGFVSLSVESNGTPIDVADRTLPARIFDGAGLTLSSIPNSAGPPGLLEPDLKRLVGRGIMDFLAFMLDELDFATGHVHQLDCGTTTVSVDPATRLPVARFQWSGCRSRGLVFTGDFTAAFPDPTVFNPSSSRLVLSLRGLLTVGGGVPTVTLDGIDWSISGAQSLPGPVQIGASLFQEGVVEVFGFEVLVDD